MKRRATHLLLLRDGAYRVLHSAAAYKHVYPLLLAQIDAGNTGIAVENRP